LKIKRDRGPHRPDLCSFIKEAGLGEPGRRDLFHKKTIIRWMPYRKTRGFSKRFDVQVYLEPGEAAVTRSGYLVTKVLDIVHNEMDIAIMDAAVETHMLDLLIYRTDAKIEALQNGGHRYMVAGRTCLAGDIFGTYTFPHKLQVGSLIPFADAAGYTMVKKNWFNGVPMPPLS